MPQFKVLIDWAHTGAFSGTYDDVTERVQQIITWAGFAENGQRVASTGHAELVLDNADGRFSPGNSASPLSGSLLPRRAVLIQAGNTAQTLHTLWRGVLETLTPATGNAGSATCTLTAVDAIDLLARQPVSVAHADSKSVATAIAEIVNAVYTPPATSIANHTDTLTHYGRVWLPEETSARDALRAICEAVYGRFWIARDGTVMYWSRIEQQDPSVTPALTLTTSDPLAGLAVDLSVGSVLNRAQVTVYPVETLGAPQTLWQAQTVLRLAPGETRVIYAPFRDENGERAGAVNVITPVAGTDYTVNDRANGSGFNYTSDPAFGLSTAIEATRAQFTLSNSATGPLYVTLLKLRGQPLRTYDPITVEHTDAASQAIYETRTRTLDLPLAADPVFAQSYAEYLVGRGATPQLNAARFVVRDQPQVAGVDVWALDLFDKVVLSEAASGLSGAGHWVRALEYHLTRDHYTVTVHVERADNRQYWLLGKTGYGKLDSETRLGF